MASAEYGAPVTGSASNAIGPDMNSMFTGEVYAIISAGPCARTVNAVVRSINMKDGISKNHRDLQG